MMILKKVVMMMLGMSKVPLGQVDQVYSQDEPVRRVPHSGFLERLGTQAPADDKVMTII